MKNTVTDSGASVASPGSIDEALETGLLPRDPHFLKTGKFKADDGAANRAEESEETEETEEQRLERELDEQEEQNEQENSASSGAQDGENAAASQAAEQQNGKHETRSSAQSESRWAKITRENRELREREAARDREIAELRARVGQPAATRDNSQASQPAAAAAKTTRPEPKIDDVENGKPKYADYAAWQRDLRAWDREQAVADFQAASAKTEQQRQQQQVQEVITREWNKRVSEQAKDLPDFKTVALDNNLPIKAGSVVDAFLLDSPIGPRVLYHLGKHRDELERIQGTAVYDDKGLVTGFRGGMNPIAQARELAKIELKLSGSGASSSSSSSAQPVTRAPRPPHQVSGKGTVSKDAVDDAVEQHSQTDYARAANERDARLQAVRRARKQSA